MKPGLRGDSLRERFQQLSENWRLVDDHHLECEHAFDDFEAALAFVNCVGALAEELNHHPDIELSWGRVKLTIFTHDADGLTDSDFDWAIRADALR
ncbi:MAG: 4a-hydroxytetrahydrobiopterin dehydratase [Myxococcota bacterium]|nr:4a-hydroxytetrahydrobiopterin dehydratase [Myxococcota bacterium]